MGGSRQQNSLHSLHHIYGSIERLRTDVLQVGRSGERRDQFEESEGAGGQQAGTF